MRKRYALILLLSFLFIASGCSKDFLKSYDKRILGTWKIIDIDRYGFSGSDALPFVVGDLFTFGEDGALTCIHAGKNYKGSWDIERRNIDDQQQKALHLVAIEFNSQEVRTENFSNMQFTGTNRFAAYINYSTRVYKYRFLRQ